MKKLFVIISIFLSSIYLFSQVNMTSDIADFRGKNVNKVYTIYCKTGISTYFEIESDMRINDFVIGDPKLWAAECNGKIGYVRPINQGIQTSLAIITENNRLYCFNLIEIALGSRETVSGKVILQLGDIKSVLKKIPIKRDLLPLKTNKQNKIFFNDSKYINSIATNYKVHKNKFKIKKVISDRLLTYIFFKDSVTMKPAVFVNSGGSKLENIKYVDKGNYYIIHHVLTNNEIFILKLGNKISKINLR